jgi:alpha-1,3-glucan synthase
LSADNSKRELSIEKFLVKSEEAFFDKVRKDKLSSAASLRSSQRDSIWGTPAPSLYDRPTCTFDYIHEVEHSVDWMQPLTLSLSILRGSLMTMRDRCRIIKGKLLS